MYNLLIFGDRWSENGRDKKLQRSKSDETFTKTIPLAVHTRACQHTPIVMMNKICVFFSLSLLLSLRKNTHKYIGNAAK